MRTIPLLAILLVAPLLAPPVQAAPAPVGVAAGALPETSVFPSDRFTRPDSSQATGLRVDLPVPQCTEATSSTCDAVELLNTLDGFDIQPRVFIPFTGAIDVATITPESVYVQDPSGARVGLQQITYDPETFLLAATTREQLAEATRHQLVITRRVRTPEGTPLAREVRTAFTTMSATAELDQIRRSLDDNSAYEAVGIADRRPSFQQGDLTTVFPPTATEFIERQDQVSTDPDAPLRTATVPNLALAGVGCYAFGSFLSPRFVRPDSTIPTHPSTQPPTPLTAERLGFALIVPAGPTPPGGWPTAVYGPGFTRSYFDLFVTSDLNAAAGIATLATHPVGHGFGPASKIRVQGPGGATFLSYGRGLDLEGDGDIEADEGSQPTKTVVRDAAGEVIEEIPSPRALYGLRGGLTQTVVDNMALVRAVEAGVEVPGCTLSPGAKLSRENVKYYGLSFGGIYGTMLMGTDPHVRDALLNVPGGPIVDIARTSAFRPRLGEILRVTRPSLLNGGPGFDGFTESWPDHLAEPITDPHPGALTIQRFLSAATWFSRPGGPEPYAPLIRKDPRNGEKNVLYQVAFGDYTVPNPTSGNIIRSGDLYDRVTYYRNDRTPTRERNPHGFLADPTLFGREMAEAQLTAFLRTGEIIDPDGPGPVFEVPIANPLNLECLHYPHPQTGERAFPPAAAGECAARAADAETSEPAPDPGPSQGPVPAEPEPAPPAASEDFGPPLAATGLPATAALAALMLLTGLALRRFRTR